MPTMVERVERFLDSALRLDAIEGVGAQASLTGAISQLDAGFRALGAATTADALFSAEHKYVSAFDALGGTLSHLGQDFLGDSRLFEAIAAFGGGGGSGRTAVADFRAVGAALGSIGTDLGTFGKQFEQLDRSTSPSDFLKRDIALCDGSVRLADEFKGASDAFGKLAIDVPSLGAGSVGADLGRLSSDFASLGRTGPTVTSATGGALELLPAGQLGAIFTQIDHDLQALDADTRGLSGPLANLLVPAVRGA